MSSNVTASSWGVVIELSVSRKVPTEETRKLECDAAKFGVFLQGSAERITCITELSHEFFPAVVFEV